jgi:hypothetical protein
VNRLLLATACCIALGGCAIANQIGMAQAKKDLVVQEAACKPMPTHVQRVDCITAAERATVMQYSTNYDLLEVMQTQRRLLADQVDAGTITDAQGAAEFATIKSQLRQIEITRGNNSAMVRAATAPVTCVRSSDVVSCF